jgi:dTDP-glucose 4,6-dehydratase
MEPKGKILVTGAGGFIGSHLVEALVRRGGEVCAFVRYNSRNDWGLLEQVDPELKGQFEVRAGDFEDQRAIAAAVRGRSLVFHLGALIAIPYSYLHPVDVVQANVLGTLNVLEACREHGVERLVQLSTSEVYGTAQYAPIDEAHPLRAQSPYAASKIAADKLAESYWLSYGLPVAIARPFNTYGPRQSARAIIPSIVSQALAREVVKIGNLKPTRDFCFVEDTVDGLIRIGEAAASPGEVINLGTGKEISIGALAEQIIALVGRPVSLVEDADRVRPHTSEVGRLLADNRKALRLLGWQPRCELKQGLERVIAWIAGHPDQYRTEMYNV